jgi:FAD:protein FMN transferase
MTAPAVHRPQPVVDDEGPGEAHWSVWGTSARVLVHSPEALDAAVECLRAELAAFDATCSRFRPDAELVALNGSSEAEVVVSDLLFATLRTAVEVAEATSGAVDPTVGTCLERLGYDRDFDELAASGTPEGPAPAPAPGWRLIQLDPVRQAVVRPPGLHLDLGATAKALCADRAAAAITAATGSGALVALGGDLAVTGATPEGGWSVVVRDEARTSALDGRCRVAVSGGGLATSGTRTRRWRRGAALVHHVVDPATGSSAPEVWQLVTVAAGSCVHANAAATAAIVWGELAPFHLAQLALPARLVDAAGTVTCVAGWPDHRR